jgi:hypothetical protein
MGDWNMDYDEQEREFAPLVGKAILNFGLIEFSTLEVAELLLNETTVRKAEKLMFKARIALLIEMLIRRHEKGEAVIRLIRLLNEAIALADTRNMIAHNPLLIDISWDKEKYIHNPIICKYLDREKKVTRQCLIKFCQDVEALAEELSDAIHSVLVERCGGR